MNVNQDAGRLDAIKHTQKPAGALPHGHHLAGNRERHADES